MHPNVEKVQAVLESLGLAERFLELPVAARTAQETAEALGVGVACIAKSLLFLTEGEPVLVIVSGQNRVDLEKVSRLLGRRVRRAGAGAVKSLTGFAAGGVPPVGHRGLRTLLDRDLLDQPVIWAGGGVPGALCRLTPDELVLLTGGEIADVREECGGQPVFLGGEGGNAASGRE